MNEIKTVTLHCLSTAVTPLTHMMGTSGNESVINRTRVMCGGQIHDVPVISGNAIRHKMVREPGAMHIVKEAGLAGKLTIDQANYLFYGGSLTESTIADNLKKIAELYELMPLIRLIGGSLKYQILGGSLLASMGHLVCEENRETLEKLLPEELILGMPELRPCEQFVSNWQYTRGDARKHPTIVKPTDDTADGDANNKMVYSGQNVIPGAIFYHSFVLQGVSRMELGALVNAIDGWQADGGIIGGGGRVGHGKMHTCAYYGANDFFGCDIDIGQCMAAYREHTKAHAQEIAAWLNEAFPAGAPRKAKAAKGSKREGQPTPRVNEAEAINWFAMIDAEDSAAGADDA